MSRPSHHIIAALGPEIIMEKTGLSAHSLRHAKWCGQFGSRWFLIIRDLCEERGIECPYEAFTFFTPSETPDEAGQ